MPKSTTPRRTPRRTQLAAGAFGAHQSIAGGFVKAVERAVETGCECLQIFTRNINRWDTTEIRPEDAAAFRDAVAEAGLAPVVAHDSYLINPAAADAELREKSIAGLAEELARAEQLGIEWVVAHPGAACGAAVEEAVARAADGIAESLLRTRGMRAGVLIETTAGQGSCLGASFEEIAAMLRRIDRVKSLSKRVGVCLDTCHVFAAGYPLHPRKKLDETLDAFDRAIGLHRLVVIHANDSKKPLGSRVDRHEAIGEGCIGQAAFKDLVNHPRLASIPMILETPKEGPDGKASPERDRANLARLRRFRRAGGA